MENIIISKEFLDWYEYYNECKEKYSSLVNDVEDKLIRGEYNEIQIPFSNMNTNNLNRDISSLEKIQVLMMQGIATSIDALSVGFTTAGYGLVMAVVCSLIVAVVTFVICETGLCLGKTLGTKLSGKADVLGGVILIGIGIVSWGRGM